MRVETNHKIKLFIILIFMTLFLAFFAYNSEYREVREYKLENGVVDLGDFTSEFGNLAFLTGEVYYYDKNFLSLDQIKSGTFDYSIRNIEEKITYNNNSDFVKTYGTYYFKVKLKSETQGHGIIMPEVATAYKLFVDGDEVLKMGTIGVNEKEHIPKFRMETISFKTQNDEFDVVIQISNFDYRIFAFLDKIAIANTQTIKSNDDLTYSKSAALSSAAFILAVFYMSIFMWLRKNKEYLYFSMFALTLCIRTLTYDNKLLYKFLDLKWKTELNISLVSTIFAIVFLIRYLQKLYEDVDDKKYSNFLRSIYILIIIPISLSTGTIARTYLVNFMIIIEFVTGIYFMTILIKGSKKKIEGSLLTLFSIFVLVVSYYFDVRNGYIQNYIIYSFYLLLVLQAVVLGKKFSSSYINLGKAKDDLVIYLEDLSLKNIELDRSRNELSEINKNLDNIVLEKTKTVKALLDNGEVKLMYIDENLIIGDEYSYNCFDVFGKNIESLNYIELFYSNVEEKNFNADLIKRIFDEKDANKKHVYMTLLPEENVINNHILKMAYKLICLENKELIMIIMDDITKERELEHKYINEIRDVRATLSVLVDLGEFKSLVNDFIEFWDSGIKLLLDDSKNDDDFFEKLMRIVHCQKGNFSIYQRKNIVSKLHYIESEISSYMTEELSAKKIFEDIKLHQLSEFIKDDINLLNQTYGCNINIDENHLDVKESNIIEICDILENDFDKRLALLKLNSLRDVSFGIIIKKYEEFIDQRGESLKKVFKSLDVVGWDVQISYSKVAHINNILNVCIRNAIYHGIELPSRRIELGKKAKGRIAVAIVDEKDQYVLSISDDGSGIDVDLLKKKYYGKNPQKYKTYNDVSYEDAISIIFEDNFSLSHDINDLAGRGVGMSSLYNEVLKYGGSISIETKKNEGTSVKISILK